MSGWHVYSLAMTPESVAGIVNHREEPASLVELLREADSAFDDATFENSLAHVLRYDIRLVDAWALWSGDQRWTPSAYVEGTETGWYDSDYEHVVRHHDAAAAVADFIHRMAAWLARREVLTFN